MLKNKGGINVDIVNKAEIFANEAHFGQTRKGKQIPFVSHLIKVVSVLKQLTDDEDLIVTGWLHDVVEDTDCTIEDIRENFNERITKFVSYESENKTLTWQERKQEQIDRLKDISEEDKGVLLVAFSDKFSNLAEMVEDYNELGDKVWNKFNNKDKNAHKWYYSTFLDEIVKRHPSLKDTEFYLIFKQNLEILFD